jgi:hypothetical protein
MEIYHACKHAYTSLLINIFLAEISSLNLIVMEGSWKSLAVTLATPENVSKNKKEARKLFRLITRLRESHSYGGPLPAGVRGECESAFEWWSFGMVWFKMV